MRTFSVDLFGEPVEVTQHDDGTFEIPADVRRRFNVETALKPSHEPIVLARKPLGGRTVAENVLAHGTGALNIDATRVGTPESKRAAGTRTYMPGGMAGSETATSATLQPAPHDGLGRWPTNLVFTHAPDCGDECADGCPVRELDGQSGVRAAGNHPAKRAGLGSARVYAGGGHGTDGERIPTDSGTASRFFPVFRYSAKPSRKERDAGLEDFAPATGGEATDRDDGSDGLKSPRAGAGRNGGARNIHPTVKPIDLLRWLIRLSTPEGGIVLDPFAGSGSTGCAAALEFRHFVGCELSPEYHRLAQARVEHWQRKAEELREQSGQRSLFGGES